MKMKVQTGECSSKTPPLKEICGTYLTLDLIDDTICVKGSVP